MSRDGGRTPSDIFQEHNLYSNAKGSATQTHKGQVSKTAPHCLFLLWSPPCECKSGVKVDSLASRSKCGGSRSEVSDSSVVVGLTGLEHPLICSWHACSLYQKQPPSRHSNKLQGNLCRSNPRASGVTQWERQSVSYLPLRASVSRPSVSPELVGNSTKLPTGPLLSLPAQASRKHHVAQI